eukprot:c13761_g2_i1 orf=163-330(+)
MPKNAPCKEERAQTQSPRKCFMLSSHSIGSSLQSVKSVHMACTHPSGHPAKNHGP